MVYMISYKIDPSKKDYISLFEKIKSLGTWMHYFNDFWLLQPSSSMTPKDIYDKLIPFIDGDTDYLLIMQIASKEASGWLPKDAWDWINLREF